VFFSEMPDLFVVNNKLSTEPGLYLYEWLYQGSNGAPVFRRRVQVTHPFKGLLPPTGTIVQVGSAIHGFWHVENNIVAHTNYDRANHGFTERRELHVQGLPRIPMGLAYLPRASSGGELLLEVYDKKPIQPSREMELKSIGYRNPEYNPFDSDPDFNPWDSAGIWRGGWPHSALYSVRLTNLVESPSGAAKRITASEHDIQFGYCGLSTLLTNMTGVKERSLVTGSYYGVLYYFRNMADTGIAFRQRQPILDNFGHVLRHPSPKASPVVYPAKDGNGHHLLVGGEGALQFYAFSSHSMETGGVPVYEQPVPVGEEGANVYGGSHPSPEAVDWDGDSRIDLIVGNAEGRILFMRNVGTNVEPRFMPGVPLKANGVEIHVQPGYHSLEGPAESRYGYACPTVVDWDGDNRLDVVMSDASARHTVFMNIGTRKNPKLAAGQSIYNDGLELHGPWRVKPAVARVNGRMAYVMLDDLNELHAYYRIDDYNVKDAGKVKLRTNKPIGAHYLSGGATGRIQIHLVDFDLDGTVDLLLAAPRHASVPEPEMGLPRSLGLPGGAILFLKGKREAAGELPRFKYPEVLHYEGAPIFIGREDGAFTVVSFGKTQGPHIMVAEEGGHIVYYERSHMSCDSVNKFTEKSQRVDDEEELQPLTYEQASARVQAEPHSHSRPVPSTKEAIEVQTMEDDSEGSASKADVTEGEDNEDEDTEENVRPVVREQRELEKMSDTASSDYSMPSFLAGAMLAPLSVGLMAVRPYVMRQFFRRVKKNNPMHSV